MVLSPLTGHLFRHRAVFALVFSYRIYHRLLLRSPVGPIHDVISTNPSSREPDSTFWANVPEQIRVSDIALLLTVPFVLTAVYLMPASIQQSLVLDYQNPLIHNLWTAAYVHRGCAHFSNNLGAYCVYRAVVSAVCIGG